MANIAETVTRICDDLSRPEGEIGDVVQREILSAISFYESKRLVFNERVVTASLSLTNQYSFSSLVANESGVEDIIAIDSIKVSDGSREYELERSNWRDMFSLDSLAAAASFPDYWSTFNKTLRLYPTPNQTLTAYITAHVKLDTLLGASGATENAWLQEGEELIRTRATGMVLSRKLDDFEKATVYRAMETDALRRMLYDAHVGRSTGILSANP